MRILLVGAKLFHADRQTVRRAGRQLDRQTDGHDEANNIRFSQFC